MKRNSLLFATALLIGLTGGDAADNSADYGDDPRGEARAAAKAVPELELSKTP